MWRVEAKNRVVVHPAGMKKSIALWSNEHYHLRAALTSCLVSWDLCLDAYKIVFKC